MSLAVKQQCYAAAAQVCRGLNLGKVNISLSAPVSHLSTTIMSKTANRSASQELVLVENQLQIAKLHQNRMSQYSSIQFINLLCYTLRNNDFKVMAVTLWHQNHMQVFLLHFFFTCSSVNNTALNLKINSINLSFFFITKMFSGHKGN